MKRKQTAQRSTTDGKHPVAAIAWLGRGSRRLWAASSCKTAPVYLCDVPLRLRAKRDLLGDSTRSQERPLCVFCVIADGGGGHSGSHGGTCPRGLRPPVKEGDSKRRTCGAAPWAPEAESLRGRDRRACFPVFAFPSSDASRGLACSGPVGAGPRGPPPAAPRGPFGPRLRPASGAQVRCSGPERLCPALPRSGTPAGSLKLATLRKVTPRKLPKAPHRRLSCDELVVRRPAAALGSHPAVAPRPSCLSRTGPYLVLLSRISVSPLPPVPASLPINIPAFLILDKQTC